MHAPKQAHRSTEFYLTVGGVSAAAFFALSGDFGSAAVLAGASIASYNLSRGIMKAGYGTAASTM